MSATTKYWRTSHGMRLARALMRKRQPSDYYPTPDEFCRVAVDTLDIPEPRWVLDPGCGCGAWGRAVKGRWPQCKLVGVDLDGTQLSDARLHGDLDMYDYIHWVDFRSFRWARKFDLVLGNPPYGLVADCLGRDMAKKYQEHVRSTPENPGLAELFLTQAMSLLCPGGCALFLLRSAFAESAGRYRRLFQYPGPLRPYQESPIVERVSFTGDGKTDATAYSLFYWQKTNTAHTSKIWVSWENYWLEKEVLVPAARPTSLFSLPGFDRVTSFVSEMT